MSESVVVVDYSRLSGRGSRPATGVVFLEISGSPFPGRGWNDFPVVFLDAWVRSLLRLVRKESKGERVYFMEGPYCVDLSWVDPETVELTGLKRPAQRILVARASLGSLVANAKEVSRRVVSDLELSGYRSTDLERLADALE
jgi:hypothetical protein